MDALVCKGCMTTWHRACGDGWDGTCPKCRTDEKVTGFDMPKVPKGQVVIEIDGDRSGGEEGGGNVVVEGEDVSVLEGEEEGVAEKESGGGTCGVGVCVYRTKLTGDLKKHKAAIHSVDIVWHCCPELRCEYKAKRKDQIKTHRALAHTIVTWHDCPELGCEYRAKQESGIKQHKAFIHNIDVVWHECPELGCEYRTKHKGSFDQHRAHLHPTASERPKRVGGVLKAEAGDAAEKMGELAAELACRIDGRMYKTSGGPSELKKRKASAHGVGEFWHYDMKNGEFICDVPECGYEVSATVSTRAFLGILVRP